MSKNKKQKKKPRKKSKHKPKRTEMKEMPSPPDYIKYTQVDVESSEDETGGQDKGLKVYIYDSELAKIRNWVLLHENIETGGDLFGLWIDSHTAVVQFALGPGKNCQRYETAFFQDLAYLASAGSYLTEKHGLCNLGQWHSHHQLSLNKPSSGDENTVWGHMPTLNLRRYIVCIANISKRPSAYHATVNCFLFELNDKGEQLPVLKGKFHRLRQESPVNAHSEVAHVIAEGAERLVSTVYEEEEDFTPESCTGWLQYKCKAQKLCNNFTKCICSPSGKALVFLVVLSAGLISIAIVFLVLNNNNQIDI